MVLAPLPRALFAAALVFTSLPAYAAFFLNGNVGLRSQQIDRDGSGNSPLSGVEKNHFGHGNLHSEWELSPYRLLSTQLDISAQRSDLTEPRDDIRVNRASLTYNQGEGTLPYRAQIGDVYALFSQRALRRNLRGAMLDLQPGENQSIQLLAGLDSSAWDQGGYANRYTGASYLVKTPMLGDLSANYVFSEDDEHGNEQRTSSLGWFKSLGGRKHQLDWEAEFLHQSNTGKDGQGLFLESTARLFENCTRLNMRFERYDEHFAPRGAVIRAGQKRWQANLAQRLGDSYLTLDALDIKQLDLDQRERNYNASYSVSLGNQVMTNLRASEREAQSFGTTSRSDSQGIQLTYAYSANLGFDLGWQQISNTIRFTGSRSESDSEDWNLGARTSGVLWGGSWYASPKLVWRQQESNLIDSREFAPSLDLGFRKQNHDLKLHYGAAIREADPATSEQRRNRNRRASVSYGYRYGTTQWRLEVGRFASHSNLVGDQEEDSVVLSVNHQFQLDGRGPSVVQTAFTNDGVIDPVLALSELIAHGEFTLAQDVALSVNPARRQHLADRSLYEGYFIAGSTAPQQLVLERQGRFLGEAHLSIDVTGMDSAEVQRLFDTVNAYLQRRFGAPAQTRDLAGLDALPGQLMQWQTTQGVLRFGLAPTLDGRRRLQISLKSLFDAPLEGIWQS